MTIHINLPPEEEADWLHSEPFGIETWSEEKRKERANEFQIEAVREHIPSGDRETAEKIFNEFSTEEFREVRKAALDKDSDGDYLDKIAKELIEWSDEIE